MTEENTNKNALPNGTVLHQYKIESMLAYGGFGIVYLGKHVQLEMRVVIKEFLPSEIATREGTTVHPLGKTERGDYDDGLERFKEEAKQLVQFQQHPNVVSCRDFFSENGTAYLVMDYEEGLSLSDLMKARQNQPLSEADILKIMFPLLDGLAYVHGQGVLHRDIKPGNIYIKRGDEQPILIDFGAAKQNFSQHSKSMAPYSPGYAAFEQVSEDGALGPWTDLYAIGAVMWRAISGANPPEVEKRMAARIRNNEDPLTPAVEFGKGHYSEAFLQAIDKCLALTEEDRYQSVSDLVTDLQQLSDEASTVAPATRVAPKPVKADPSSLSHTMQHGGVQTSSAAEGNKKKIMLAGIAASVVAIIAAVIIFGSGESSTDPASEPTQAENRQQPAPRQTQMPAPADTGQPRQRDPVKIAKAQPKKRITQPATPAPSRSPASDTGSSQNGESQAERKKRLLQEEQQQRAQMQVLAMQIQIKKLEEKQRAGTLTPKEKMTLQYSQMMLKSLKMQASGASKQEIDLQKREQKMKMQKMIMQQYLQQLNQQQSR